MLPNALCGGPWTPRGEGGAWGCVGSAFGHVVVTRYSREKGVLGAVRGFGGEPGAWLQKRFAAGDVSGRGDRTRWQPLPWYSNGYVTDVQGHLHLEVHAHFEKVSTDTVFSLGYMVRIRPEPVEPFSRSESLSEPNTVTLSFESGASVE